MKRMDKRILIGVYGGQKPPADELLKLLGKPAVRFPGGVVAFSYGKSEYTLKQVSQNERFKQWKLPLFYSSGIGYLFFSKYRKRIESELDTLEILRGDIQSLDNVSHFFHAVQNAIVSLRRSELALRKANNNLLYNAELESNAFKVALKYCSPGHSFVTEALRFWLDVIFIRHHNKTGTIHRKLCEFFSHVTLSVDKSDRLKTDYFSTIKKIHATYVIHDLETVFVDALTEIETIHKLKPKLQQSDKDRVNESFSPLIQRTIFFINENYKKPLKLETIANEMHVSPVHLSRVFHKETGQKLSDYIIELRILLAKQLLLETDYPILAVVDECGFGVSEHFYRIFKRKVGLPPGAFRKKHKSQEA